MSDPKSVMGIIGAIAFIILAIVFGGKFYKNVGEKANATATTGLSNMEDVMNKTTDIK